MLPKTAESETTRFQTQKFPNRPFLVRQALQEEGQVPSLNRKMGALCDISLLMMIWGYQIESLTITKHQLGFNFVGDFLRILP